MKSVEAAQRARQEMQGQIVSQTGKYDFNRGAASGVAVYYRAFFKPNQKGIGSEILRELAYRSWVPPDLSENF